MSEEQNIEQSPEDSKFESHEEVKTISLQETIEQNQPQIENSEIPKSEIKEMEVHHHPHVEKKNFKEYFLEFLMIFLAVTMGFFAENLREHIVDKNLEHAYISSFYEDLSNDGQQLPSLVKSIQYQQLYPADSLQLLLSSATTTTPANNIYRFLRIIVRQQSVTAFVTDRTIEQLKNAGEMHLISNKQIADSLVDYYKDIAFIAELQQDLLAIKSQLANNDHPLLNGYDYDKFSDSSDNIVSPAEVVYLKSANPDVVNNCLLDISNIKGLSRGVKQLILRVANKGENIKYLIAENYNII